MIRPDWTYQYPSTFHFFGTWPSSLWQQQDAPQIIVSSNTPLWIIITLAVVFVLAVRTLWVEIERRREHRAWRAAFTDGWASEEWGCPMDAVKADERD